MAAPRPKRACVRAPGYYHDIVGGRPCRQEEDPADDSESDIDLEQTESESESSESDDGSESTGTVSDNEEAEHVDDGWVPVRCDTEDPVRRRAFTVETGPQHMPADMDGPTDYLELFLTDELLRGWIVETERYAAQYIGQNSPLQVGIQ